MTMSAHPADLARGDTQQKRVVGVTAADDGARANECVAAEVGAADDGRVGSERRPAPHQRGDERTFPRQLGSRIFDVREYARGAAEDVVFQLDAVVQRNVILNFDAVADLRARGNEYVLSEVTALPDHGSRHHMTE